MRTQTYSRRAIASGLSLAALASPAVAFPTLAAVNGSADNELFVLGVKLHQAHEEARAASDAFQTAYKPMLDKAWEMTLATGAEMRSPGAEALYHEIALQLHKADPQYDELDHQQLAAWCRYDDIAGKIVALPCQTLPKRSRPNWDGSGWPVVLSRGKGKLFTSRQIAPDEKGRASPAPGA